MKKEELEKIANKLLEKEILFQNDLEKLIGKRPFKTNLELSLEDESTQESKEEIKNENELDGKVVLNKTWEPYCYHYAKRARTYLEEAKQLLPLLPRRTRYSPAAMIAFYDKIE